jgi:phage baseplate assembly protein gpV
MKDGGESTGKDNWDWWHLGDQVEILCNGNSQELKMVTLANTPSSGGYGA